MKTSIELDTDKVNLAKSLVSVPTLRELIDKALDALIADARRHNMANLLGTDFFEGDLDKMRGRNGRVG